MGSHREFGLLSLVARWLLSVFLVFAAYNASGYSYYHWLIDTEAGNWIFKFTVGTGLAFWLWVVFDITRRSLHPTGFVLIAAFCGFATWYLVDEGYVTIRNQDELTTLVQFAVVGLLTVGLSYSHVHYRLGGVKQIEQT